MLVKFWILVLIVKILINGLIRLHEWSWTRGMTLFRIFGNCFYAK
jgi:hypothetical protein